MFKKLVGSRLKWDRQVDEWENGWQRHKMLGGWTGEGSEEVIDCEEMFEAIGRDMEESERERDEDTISGDSSAVERKKESNSVQETSSCPHYIILSAF